MDDDFPGLRKTQIAPKPTSGESWWTKCSTREALNQEAQRRFPSATTGESFTGVIYQTGKRHGTL